MIWCQLCHGFFERACHCPATPQPPEPTQWIILFTSPDGAGNEWEPAEGTLDQAIEQATCDNRHLNYGRNGFRIVPDVSRSP